MNRAFENSESRIAVMQVLDDQDRCVKTATIEKKKILFHSSNPPRFTLVALTMSSRFGVYRGHMYIHTYLYLHRLLYYT